MHWYKISVIILIYLFKSSPLFFLKTSFFWVGDSWFCKSSMAAEVGVGKADGIEVVLAVIWCIIGLESVFGPIIRLKRNGRLLELLPVIHKVWHLRAKKISRDILNDSCC